MHPSTALQSLFKNQLKNGSSFFLIAGPCVVEGEDLVVEVASQVKQICEQLNIPFIFKASYRKANRTSGQSFTGIGDEKALHLIQKIGHQLHIPTLTDIHLPQEAAMAAAFVDVLQIPAFLCRQTDLLLAAAQTGKWINIKKGQFLNGAAMRFAVEKIQAAGNPHIFLTERGNSFGYQDLIVDFRNIPIMQGFDTPVVVDCTHSLQQPNQASGITGGNPLMIGTIAKAAIATGADGLFIETHPNPALAKSDGANMLPLQQLAPLLQQLVKIREAVMG